MVAEKPHDLNRVEHNALLLHSCNTNISDKATEISFFFFVHAAHNADILSNAALYKHFVPGM